MSGCATTRVTRYATQPLSNIVDGKDIVAIIDDVLVKNGFKVVSIDEKRGFISSDWRPYEDRDDTGLNILTNTVHSREISLSFYVSANKYEIMPKIKLKSSTKNDSGGSKEDIVYVRKSSTEEKIVVKVVEEVNKRLREPNSIQWVDRLDLSGQDIRQ